MDYFDLSVNKGGLSKIFKNTNVKFCFFTLHQIYFPLKQKR